jgi:predicted nucleic acid-binding protein
MAGGVSLSSATADDTLSGIDPGERAAIQLAITLHADLLLMDDRKGVAAAESKGLLVTGTLGILDIAAERGLVDFTAAIRDLERTSFRRPTELLHSLLAKHEARKRG